MVADLFRLIFEQQIIMYYKCIMFLNIFLDIQENLLQTSISTTCIPTTPNVFSPHDAIRLAKYTEYSSKTSVSFRVSCRSNVSVCACREFCVCTRKLRPPRLQLAYTLSRCFYVRVLPVCYFCAIVAVFQCVCVCVCVCLICNCDASVFGAVERLERIVCVCVPACALLWGVRYPCL